MILTMKKQTRKNEKFSPTEVGALIEALRSEIKPALEAIPDMQDKLDNIFEQVGVNTQELGIIKTAVKINTEKINQILEGLKSKVDRKDFEIQILQRRELVNLVL